MKYNESNVHSAVFNADAPYIYDGKGNYTFSARSLAILFNKIVVENETVVDSVVETPKKIKMVDWSKAGALKKAGWSNKNIAEELGIQEHQVDLFFKARMAHLG